VADDLGALSDEEKAAILAHRRDSAPKRKATANYTDEETGVQYSIELLPEEASKLVGKLFAEPKAEGEGDEKGKKPTPLKDYFGGKGKTATS
jgi:hypothetical protein